MFFYEYNQVLLWQVSSKTTSLKVNGLVHNGLINIRDKWRKWRWNELKNVHCSNTSQDKKRRSNLCNVTGDFVAPLALIVHTLWWKQIYNYLKS